MGYPGIPDRVITNPAPEDDLKPGAKLAAMYQVSVQMYEGGHVCARLIRLDMGSRRVISVNLGCYVSAVAAESAALDCIVDASLTRRQALGAGVE